MKAYFSVLLVLLLANSAFSQIPDSLNRFDSKKHKTGYWLTYLDSNLVKTEEINAVFGGFEYYNNGKLKSAPFPKKDNWKNASRVYLSDSLYYIDSVEIVNGELQINQVYTASVERYEKGMLHYARINYYTNEINENPPAVTETIYLDSLLNNLPFTLLIYTEEDGKLISKQYGGRDVKADLIYLVPHLTKTSINRPRIGYTFQHRSFLELGYSKKFARTTKVQDGEWRLDETNFPGFTLSLLGSWSKKRGNYFGQKALFSYCFTFVNSEFGFVNYTDFKTNDLRLTFGTGVSIAGRFSLMYHYYIPLLSDRFIEISQHSISLVLF